MPVQVDRAGDVAQFVKLPAGAVAPPAQIDDAQGAVVQMFRQPASFHQCGGKRAHNDSIR